MSHAGLDSYLTRQLIKECDKVSVEILEHRLKEFDRLIEELQCRREIVQNKIRERLTAPLIPAHHQDAQE